MGKKGLEDQKWAPKAIKTENGTSSANCKNTWRKVSFCDYKKILILKSRFDLKTVLKNQYFLKIQNFLRLHHGLSLV